MASPSAFWAPIEAKLQQRHDDAQELARQQRSAYQSIIQDPNTSDDVKNWAWGEWQKSLHPDARKRFGKLQPIVNRIMGALGQQSAQQSPVPAPTGPIFDTEAANKRMLDLLQQKSDIEQNRQIAVAQARPAATGTRKDKTFKLPGSDEVISVQQDSRTGQYYTMGGEPTELPEGAEPYKVPAPGTRRQYFFRDPEGKEHMVFQDSRTQQPFDARGKPMEIPDDWEPIDEQAKLAKIRGSFFGTGEMNNLKRAFKSQYPDISDEEAERMAGAVATERAQRLVENIGVARSAERPMVVGGEVRAVPLVSAPVRRPFDMPTPQAASGGQPAAVPAGDGAPPATAAPRPAPAAVPGSVPRASAQPNVPAAGRSLGVPPAQYRAMLNDIRAVRAGAGQLFGDPNVPGMKGLAGYGGLADKKESRARLGEALRLTFDGLDKATGHSGAGLGGDGLSIDIGGIAKYVENRLGIPSAVADAQAKMMQKALGVLTPEEAEAYNATIASAEGIIGLRRITGASPSQQSVRAIQEAMPLIGVNTVDKAQFDDKMQRLALEFSAGTRGVPRVGFDPETQKQIDELDTLATRMGRKSTAPKAAPRPAPPKKGEVMDGYEFLGGDPADPKSWKKK